jgi:hypothetical protein
VQTRASFRSASAITIMALLPLHNAMIEYHTHTIRSAAREEGRAEGGVVEDGDEREMRGVCRPEFEDVAAKAFADGTNDVTAHFGAARERHQFNALVIEHCLTHNRGIALHTHRWRCKPYKHPK